MVFTRSLTLACASFIVACTGLTSHSAHADTNHIHPNDHAPIGVMGDHTHEPGEWMLSYRYMSMSMRDNRSGTRDVTTAEVLSNFMVAPLDMRMEMHMPGVMVGVTDRVTLMGMLPYIRKEMDHVTRMGRQFRTTTEGVGDAKLSGLITLYDRADADGHNREQLHLTAGISAPTGATDERGDTPAMANAKLPYPMQLGSGTWDPLFALTYNQYRGPWGVGVQLGTTIRLGDNDEGYRLGNEYHTSLWGSYAFSPWWSASLRLNGKSWDEINGRDAELNPMIVPTARPDLRGGERVDMLAGINFLVADGPSALQGQRLALEVGAPVYQRLDGPQLETDVTVTLGWQYSF